MNKAEIISAKMSKPEIVSAEMTFTQDNHTESNDTMFKTDVMDFLDKEETT